MPTQSNAPGATAPPEEGSRPFSHELARNVRTLAELRERSERKKGTQDRIADAITAFTGSMPFVYLHAVLFGGWIVLNVGLLPIQPFDPTFVVLAMVASVEAIFLSTFVLISQNRMMEQADKRAELDLQISLLAEHEMTRAITLLDAVAERLGVEHGDERDVEEAKQDVDPAVVFEALEEEDRAREHAPRGRGRDAQ
jgi:uncharacterized membrane protein